MPLLGLFAFGTVLTVSLGARVQSLARLTYSLAVTGAERSLDQLEGTRLAAGTAEIKTLRWYCLEEGGCLFVDNGGGTFHSAMTSLLRRVFPEKSLRDIANDDPILDGLIGIFVNK